jgi:predicted P-loop ATPase
LSTPVDVRTYYRQITDLDIGTLAREMLGGRVTQESGATLFCDCPNHRSQSHRSLQVMLDKQGWYCFGCGVGGDVLQLVEFLHAGTVTRGQSGVMPKSHREARDFLAARVGLPPLSQLGRPAEEIAAAEEEHRLTWRVREALAALAEIYHQRLLANAEVLAWFRSKYGIGNATIVRLKIGFAENVPSPVRALTEGAGAFTLRELSATSAFRPTAQDGLFPFFEGRVVFPYWSRGNVVFMIGRRTPWTPDQEWEKSKYKKLPVRNDRSNEHVAQCIQNDVLYNEDVLLTRPERVIITEGVTDCISLMEHGFPALSPVTVRIREADWERLLPKLAGVKTVFICQDNEISEAGLNGALKTARILGANGIATRVAVLPLGEKQRAAREKLAGLPADTTEAEALLADAKIDVNEFFASGKTTADFEQILAVAQTPLEMAIAALSADTPDSDLARVLGPLLAEVSQLDPIAQPHLLKQIQEKCGKERLPITALRKQMKIVRIDSTKNGNGRGAVGTRGSGTQLALATQNSDNWRNGLLLNLNGTVKPLLANAITALRQAPEWAGLLAYDDFALNTVILRPAPWMSAGRTFPFAWSGTEDILTADWLQHQGICVPSHVAGQAVEAVAKAHRIHPVREYLESLTWDGTPRLATWLSTYLGVEPSPYTSAVGSRWMISAAARIFAPGSKADTCLILEGPQGIKKSTALRVLSEPWFAEEIAELGSKDASMQLQGVWVIEIAELESMSRTDVGRVKDFMSHLTDRFRPPYGLRTIKVPRQCIFAGSVNHGTYLRDETGARRFWPVDCKAPVIDSDGLAEARDQLWAEAAYLFHEGKVWWLDSPELNRRAAEEQADRYEGDPWDELITKWINERADVSIAEILGSCIDKRKDQWTQLDKNRVARCLRSRGWERFNAGPRSAREWRYRQPGGEQ